MTGIVSADECSVPIDTIKRACVARFRISHRDLIADRRDAPSVRARHVAMFLSRRLTTKSSPTIARLFGDRDHTTVLYAHRSITERITRDAALAADVNALLNELEPTVQP